MFITFEGIEGTGKTTQIKLLADYLGRQGKIVVVTREPGGTAIGDQIRSIVLSSHNSHITPFCELLLYNAGRAQHVNELILPELKKGHIVLCDRFADATLAYQGFARGLAIDLINELNVVAMGELKPNLTILLDGDVESGLTRSRARLEREKKDEGRFEAEALEFHKKVRDGYLQIAQSDPERVKVIKADQDILKVHQEIVKLCSSVIK